MKNLNSQNQEPRSTNPTVADFVGREFNMELLEELYKIPSSVFSSKDLAEILTNITGNTLDTAMVSKLFNEAGLPLRNRMRVYPKPETTKEPRVTKAEVLNNLFGQLGINTKDSTDETDTDAEVVNGEVNDVEQEHVDEMVESHQFGRAYQNGVV